MNPINSRAYHFLCPPIHKLSILQVYESSWLMEGSSTPGTEFGHGRDRLRTRPLHACRVISGSDRLGTSDLE